MSESEDAELTALVTRVRENAQAWIDNDEEEPFDPGEDDGLPAPPPNPELAWARDVVAVCDAIECVTHRIITLEAKLARERERVGRLVGFVNDCADTVCIHGSDNNGPCPLEDSDDPHEYCHAHRARRILAGDPARPARSLSYDLDRVIEQRDDECERRERLEARIRDGGRALFDASDPDDGKCRYGYTAAWLEETFPELFDDTREGGE